MEAVVARQKIYDAIIIGSGASGGMAAKQLTEKGLQVLVLEAGPPVNPARDFSSHKWAFESMYRGFGPPGWKAQEQWMQDTAGEFSRHFYIKDTEHPYTTDPGKPFLWVRARIVGGKTLHWGRLSWRLSDLDFKAATHDGFGDDWPISYEEIAPYYDRAEEFIGVSGNRDGLDYLPDGKFMPPMKLNCGEQFLRKGAEKTGRKGIVSRVAMLTGTPKPHMKGRNKCHYCGHCGQGCDVGAMFNSVASTLPVALATGRMTLRTNAVVRHILIDPDTGKAKGVAVVDRETRREYEEFGKMIVVAASALESTRLLLNSKSRQHPNGLGNSSGVLGHYLMDHTYSVSVGGVVPAVAKFPYNYDDGRANGVYIPKFRNISPETKHPKFLRGYGIQASVQRSMLPVTVKNIPGFGSEFKRLVREADAPAPFWIGAFGEMLPRFENTVTVNKDVKDAWGIPVAHIDCAYSDNEREMARDQLETLKEMAHEAGFEVYFANPYLAPPGLCIHEVGTARMGNDPKTSVLNKFNQSWDVKNLFVTDGACFVSIGCQNPTDTMMAITARACDYIVDEYKKGNL